MKRRLLQVCAVPVVLFVAAMGAMAAQGALRSYYANDPVGRNVISIESRAPLETMLSRTSAVTGEIHVNPENILDKPQAKFEVDLNQLDTGIALRNEHMKSAAWLDTAKFPTATFELTSIVPPAFDGPAAQMLMDSWATMKTGQTQHLSVFGTMTLHGVAKLVVAGLEVMPTPASDATKDRLPGDLLHVRATFTIKLSDFGISVPAMAQTKVADEQTVTADIFTSTESPKPGA